MNEGGNYERQPWKTLNKRLAKLEINLLWT